MTTRMASVRMAVEGAPIVPLGQIVTLVRAAMTADVTSHVNSDRATPRGKRTRANVSPSVWHEQA